MNEKCPYCKSENTRKVGRRERGERYICQSCAYIFDIDENMIGLDGGRWISKEDYFSSDDNK